MAWNELSAEDKLKQARIDLRQKHFFSYLVMHLHFIEDKECPTMGVDNKGYCVYNPDFINELTRDECSGLICHEVMHCAFEHLLRLNGRNPELFNIVNDAIVNGILIKEDFSLPDGGAKPDSSGRFRFGNITVETENKCSEEVYDYIYKIIREQQQFNSQQMKQYLQQKGQEMKGFDEHNYDKDGNGKSNKNKNENDGKGNSNNGKNKSNVSNMGGDIENELSKKWRKVLGEACAYSKSQGTLPAGMQRLVSKLFEIHIDWKSLLYKYITSELPVDYNWSRPSKRTFSTGIYMPSIEKEKIEVNVWIDTSGSISQDELDLFMSEVLGILKQFRNVDLTIGDCDAEINNVKTYRNAQVDEVIEFDLSGGGGTSHIPVFKWIRENKPQTRLVICFTDGYTSFPEPEDVTGHVIWVVAGRHRLPNESFPFGDVVEIPIEE